MHAHVRIGRATSERVLFAIAFSVICAPALAVNKCVSASGAVTYQDHPCAGAGKTIDVSPNSVAPVRDPTVSKNLRAIDARLAERARKDETERVTRGRRIAAHARECQGYLDDEQRQRAWLNSISVAARQSASAEIDIARRHYRDAGCANPNYIP